MRGGTLGEMEAQTGVVTRGDGAGDEEGLAAFVAGRDVPCPACGYSLRGLRAGSCPECGERLELRVGLAEPRMGLWIAGLVGLAAGAGFNGLLLVYVAIQLSGYRGLGSLWDRFVIHNLIGAAVEGGLLGLWLTQRRRIRQMPRSGRAVLVMAAWAVAVANVALFSAYIH